MTKTDVDIGPIFYCEVKDCSIELSLEVSLEVGICFYCRREIEESWDDDDWLLAVRRYIL